MPDQTPSNQALAQAVYTNYCDMWRTVGALSPTDGAFEVIQRQDSLLIKSRLVQRVPHTVLDPHVADGAARTWATSMVNDLGHDPVSILVRLPPGLEKSPLVGALQGEGFQREVRPAIALTRQLRSLTVRTPDHAITLAEREHELEEARTLLARVFGLPPAVFAFYTPPKLVLTYLLRIKGVAVGATCLCSNGESAGIYSVGVMPTMRGRGYAQRLVWHALAEAARMRLNLAVLTCERHLVSFYEQLGFSACWELHSYWLEAWWR
jgi:GNAT superfamily N-acetyltransferase